MNIKEIQKKYMSDSLASKEANNYFHEAKKAPEMYSKNDIKAYAWTKAANQSLKDVEIQIDAKFNPFIRLGGFGRSVNTSHMSVPEALKLSQELAKAARYIQNNKR